MVPFFIGEDVVGRQKHFFIEDETGKAFELFSSFCRINTLENYIRNAKFPAAVHAEQVRCLIVRVVGQPYVRFFLMVFF